MIEHCYKSPDGTNLTWYETGQGKPLVLLHGWSMSAAVFTELAAELAADFRLLIPDLPGHGKSSSLPKTSLSEVACFLSGWLKCIETEPLSIVGWSLGGMLALELASAGEVPVERLVLAGTTPRFVNGEDWTAGLPATQVRALKRNLGRRFESTLGEFFALAFAGENLSPERMREIRNFAVRQSPLPDHNAAQAFLEILEEQDQRQTLANLDLPVLVLHGAMDQITPVDAGRYMAEALPQGRLVELPATGHALFLSQPGAVAAEIRAFC